MIFNSTEFVIFFLVVCFLYGAVFNRDHLRNVVLLLSSYAFYTAWAWEYAGLIAASTLVDYFIGLKLQRETRSFRRKVLALTSLIFNLGLLAFFKYFNFFAESYSSAITIFGWDASPIRHEFLLPVGISFYTFQTLSYTLDLYRGEIKAERSLIKFAIFVSFFPQLVAGPIVRAKEFLPQLNRQPNVSQENVQLGLKLVFIGLFKKIVIADSLAFMAVDSVFANPSAYSSFDLMMGLYAYAFQIYCDFSGYSDIAIGLAAILGFRLPVNFNRPYIAIDPRDFWRRWHISLSTWLRDYLYISLGGSRGGRWKTYRNLALTMLLGGLWHGAALNFVFWGAYHGLLLIAARAVSPNVSSPTLRAVRIFITFHLVLFGWLLFRVPDMATFNSYVAGISSLSFATQLSAGFYLLLITATILHVIPRNWILLLDESLPKRIRMLATTMIYVAALVVFVGFSFDTPQFIYFQF